MSTLDPSGRTHALFRRVVADEFSPIAQQCRSRLIDLGSWRFGFSTQTAIVTVGAYDGHLPSIVVKLRERRKEEPVLVDDSRDIGLGNLMLFVDGASEPKSRPSKWDLPEIEREIRALATDTVKYVAPFVSSPTPDWDGLRTFVDRRIEAALAAMPKLKMQWPTRRTTECG